MSQSRSGGQKRVWITDFFSSIKKPKSEKSKVMRKREGDRETGETKKCEEKTASEEKCEERSEEKSERTEEKSQKTEIKSERTEEKSQETEGMTEEKSQKSQEISQISKGISQKSEHSKSLNDQDYTQFCKIHNFNKQEWVASLTEDQKSLLSLEIHTLHITWLVFLHKELTKPYFLKLKRFLVAQKGKTIFPPPHDVYSWSHYTPLPEVKCLIMGQDPYHNHHQAHGLAFSVLEPTRPPPSLVNIYKALHIDFPAFEIPTSGNLSKWAKSGVLMLNACLTVEAHKANSHANQGWETFTEHVIKAAISYHQKNGFVIMAWGSSAQKRISSFSGVLKKDFCVIKSVHPSPLSAHRGFFDAHVFQKCNDWLRERNKEAIDWGIVPGNAVS